MSEWNKVKEDIEILNKSKNGSSSQDKKQKIAYHFKKIMEVLDLDLSDDSLIDTPDRVAKMYVDELFSGLNKNNEPVVSKFENSYNYNGIILEKNIQSYKLTLENINQYTEALSKDKKNQGNQIGCILSKKPGSVEKVFIENDNWLKECIIEYSNIYFK